MMKKLTILSSVFLLLVISGCSPASNSSEGEDLQASVFADPIPLEKAQEKAETFINETLLKGQKTATFTESTEEKGLYKFKVDLGNGQSIETFMTKDGQTFFPQAMNIEEVKKQAAEAAKKEKEAAASTAQDAKAALENVEKREKASVELFIMSHCPFGTQIEKGMLPVLDTLGDEVDFQLKFVNYAMHGKKELDEQMVQYCIQEEEPEKLTEYLTCFLGSSSGEASDSEKCQNDLGIDVSSCVAATDEEYNVTANFEDKDSWLNGRFPVFEIHQTEAKEYGVQGSPSLVVNGQKVSSGRDSKSLLNTICAGYENPPEACNAELDSTNPAPGFGFGGQGSNTDASCG